jgi:hypothetical protein
MRRCRVLLKFMFFVFLVLTACDLEDAGRLHDRARCSVNAGYGMRVGKLFMHSPGAKSAFL